MTDGADAAHLIHQLRWWTDPEAFHWRMRDDPGWAAGIRFACEHGIPASVFFGRVVRPGEPQWLAEDTETAVAFEQWAGQICGGCGLHPLDWPSERDETWKGRIDTCFGCAEIGDTRSMIPKSMSEARRSSIRVHLVPRSAPERTLLEAREEGLVPDDIEVPDFT